MSVSIRSGSRVRLHFALRLADSGATVESTFGQRPAELVLGQGPLLPGFEAVLEGLAAGARQTFTLSPEQAFGAHREANVQGFPRARFPGMEPVPGLVIQFNEAAGGGLPGVVTAADDERVTVDFNHPLAGRTLHFEVEILAVEPPEAP